ncbi:EYxxD motif small membrane protein [Brevibacillus sp. H7]
MAYGTPWYEWFSHNAFVLLLAIGTVGAMAYFIYISGKKKGRYRQ